MTFEVMLQFRKKISAPKIFLALMYVQSCQNRFVNECAKKNLAKIPGSRSHIVPLRDIEESSLLKIIMF